VVIEMTYHLYNIAEQPYRRVCSTDTLEDARQLAHYRLLQNAIINNEPDLVVTNLKTGKMQTIPAPREDEDIIIVNLDTREVLSHDGGQDEKGRYRFEQHDDLTDEEFSKFNQGV
jgi:hypothetical protein